METNLKCVGCGQPLRETGVGLSILGASGLQCKVCQTQYVVDFIVRKGSSKPVIVLQPLPSGWKQQIEDSLFPPENVDPYNNGRTPQDFPRPEQINPHFANRSDSISAHSPSKVSGKECTVEGFKNLIKESLSPTEFIKKLSTE